MGDRKQFLQSASKYSFETGWGLDIYTPVEELEDGDLKRVSGILLMSVKAGFSGQRHRHITEKIRNLRTRGFIGDIVVDGGMNKQTIPHVLKSGANQFSVTSAIWKAEDPVEQWKKLTELVNKEIVA